MTPVKCCPPTAGLARSHSAVCCPATGSHPDRARPGRWPPVQVPVTADEPQHTASEPAPTAKATPIAPAAAPLRKPSCPPDASCSSFEPETMSPRRRDPTGQALRPVGGPATPSGHPTDNHSEFSEVDDLAYGSEPLPQQGARPARDSSPALRRRQRQPPEPPRPRRRAAQKPAPGRKQMCCHVCSVPLVRHDSSFTCTSCNRANNRHMRYPNLKHWQCPQCRTASRYCGQCCRQYTRWIRD